MSRTKRIYNRHPIGYYRNIPIFHPYEQLYVGHCRGCRMKQKEYFKVYILPKIRHWEEQIKAIL